MNANLPGWAIDLITDGIPQSELRQRGNPAVIGALVKTAMSAQHRDWSVMEWETVLTHRGRHLATQLRQGTKPQTPAQTRKSLQYAWNLAWQNRTTTPPWDSATVHAEVTERVRAARAAAGSANLDPADSRVLRFAADEAERRTLTRVALARRTVAEATGLGEKAARNSIRRLTAAGWLNLAQAGSASGPKARTRRANIYELAPNKSRGTRPVGPLPDNRVQTPCPRLGQAARRRVLGRCRQRPYRRSPHRTPPRSLSRGFVSPATRPGRSFSR